MSARDDPEVRRSVRRAAMRGWPLALATITAPLALVAGFAIDAGHQRAEFAGHARAATATVVWCNPDDVVVEYPDSDGLLRWGRLDRVDCTDYRRGTTLPVLVDAVDSSLVRSDESRFAFLTADERLTWQLILMLQTSCAGLVLVFGLSRVVRFRTAMDILGRDLEAYPGLLAGHGRWERWSLRRACLRSLSAHRAGRRRGRHR